MKIQDFVNKESILDISFFNFSNAVTAAYFASSELNIVRVNNNFKKFFPVLKNVENLSFLAVLEQLGVPESQIEEFRTTLKENGEVIIPRIEILVNGEEKVYSLLSKVTKSETFFYLNGVQGQFVDRTAENKLRNTFFTGSVGGLQNALKFE